MALVFPRRMYANEGGSPAQLLTAAAELTPNDLGFNNVAIPSLASVISSQMNVTGFNSFMLFISGGLFGGLTMSMRWRYIDPETGGVVFDQAIKASGALFDVITWGASTAGISKAGTFLLNDIIITNTDAVDSSFTGQMFMSRR